MDLLFGEAERTDAEKAVLGYGEPDRFKFTGTSTHLENAGYANAAAGAAGRLNTVEVMTPVDEEAERRV
jgi:hypothetical protein